jgi:hypothetical protein
MQTTEKGSERNLTHTAGGDGELVASFRLAGDFKFAATAAGLLQHFSDWRLLPLKVRRVVFLTRDNTRCLE